MSELSYKDEAASAYDRAFAHVSTHFLPFLLRSARLEPGQRVLDVATGTGIAAEAALAVVGPSGHVTAADVSQAMVDRAPAPGPLAEHLGRARGRPIAQFRRWQLRRRAVQS